MNYKFFISSLLVTLATTASAQSKTNDPIRYANGTAVITKSTMVEDPNSGKVFFKRETVCKKDVLVPVFDMRGNNSPSIDPVRISCETQVDGKTEKIESLAHITYGKFPLYEGAPFEDYKLAGTFNWIGTDDKPSKLQAPPFQTFMTRDLNQKNFILLSANPQGQSCSKNSSGVMECKNTNPVGFEIVWDIQDTQ